MDPPYGAIFLLLIFFGLAGIVGIVKARRKKEKTYYLISGVSFLVVIAVVAALLNQFLLSFFIIVVSGLASFVLLPKVMQLYGQEIIEQKQETDVSAPLRLKDFLTWKAWIKLESKHGFRKMITIYSVFNVIVVAVLMLSLLVFGVVTPVMVMWYLIPAGIVSTIIFYRQIWKAFKN
jgi:hypothetical protein